MDSPWSLPFVEIFLSSSVSSYNTTVIKFDGTDQYSAAEGCAMEFADRLSSEFKYTHSCSPEDAFSCICENATASSLLRDDIWDSCVSVCGLGSAYAATSVLVGYCASNSKRVNGLATNTAATTREIYGEDTDEHTTAVISKDCPAECVVPLTRSFKLDHSCDPVDSFPCICGNPKSSSLLTDAISKHCATHCGGTLASHVTSILVGYCLSNSKRVNNGPARTTAITTSRGTTSTTLATGGTSSSTSSTAAPENQPAIFWTGGTIGGITVAAIVFVLFCIVGLFWLARTSRIHNGWIRLGNIVHRLRPTAPPTISGSISSHELIEVAPEIRPSESSSISHQIPTGSPPGS